MIEYFLFYILGYTSQLILCIVCFQRIEQEFDQFQQLFDRFLTETGPSVDWEKIRLLPDEAVSTLYW